jgi:RNA polymerase sigma-70 factor (ECF subfamily)
MLDPDGDALVARVIAGDKEAFAVIVRRFGTPLHRIAYRMLNDTTEAEDVAQEALLRLWTIGTKWEQGRAGVAAWLKRVTVNLCLDRLRRRKFTSDDEVPERVDDSASADEEMDKERVRAATVACIQRLPDRQRAAIVLTYYEEMPNTQAASVMEMQIKAFESLLFRARAALREAMLATGMIGADTGKGGRT